MQIGVPNQTTSVERRVAVTPDVANRLVKQEFSVTVETGAGVAAGFPDQHFEEAGATVVDTRSAWGAELVTCLSAPTDKQAELLRSGGILLGLLEPLDKPRRMERLAAAGITTGKAYAPSVNAVCMAKVVASGTTTARSMSAKDSPCAGRQPQSRSRRADACLGTRRAIVVPCQIRWGAHTLRGLSQEVNPSNLIRITPA